jgi:hypothetical protein
MSAGSGIEHRERADGDVRANLRFGGLAEKLRATDPRQEKARR